MLHLTADSLHESLQLGESVCSLQPQLTLRQIVVGFVLQQLQSLPDMKVWLLQSRPAMTTQFYQPEDAGDHLSHLNSSVETWPASHFLLAAWRIGMWSSK